MATTTKCRFSHRLRKGRSAITLFAALLVAFPFCVILAQDAAAEAKKYASIAYDANTGRTLFETFGEEERFPASLTKIMTLYMVFDLIEKGRLTYDSEIPISAQAAAQPPSKLGLDVGEKIRLVDAIKALVTKSANDIAVAVAEKIAGSESQFARLMTKKAREIGMKKTVFKNASGLPDDEQVTTARDMVTLALRLQDEFPLHYKLFSTRYFSYRGKRYKNHNTLLGKVNGVDGIKTGYIRASGFNLVSSVRREGKHVIAVVFGGKTAARRNAHMRSIIARALDKASTRKTRKPVLIAKPHPVIRPTLPVQKPVLDQRIEVGRADPPPRLRPTISVAKVRLHDFSEPKSATRSMTEGEAGDESRLGRNPGTLQDQLAALLANSGIANVGEGSSQGAPSPEEEETGRLGGPQAGRVNGSYLIQVGAYESQQEAEAQLGAVARRADRLLDGYAQRTEAISSGPKTIYRARFAGFDAEGAAAACSELRRRSIDCFVTRSR
jgi:D-alanyl-D-alanine carboxypeptidase